MNPIVYFFRYLKWTCWMGLQGKHMPQTDKEWRIAMTKYGSW